MQNSADGYVRSDVASGVATITFFHPKSNSLPGNLLAELSDAVTVAGRNPDARVIVMRSDGDGRSAPAHHSPSFRRSRIRRAGRNFSWDS
jgi:enoyl-CoA hydratase/carnithine racemase